MTKTILVTGACGYIASHTIDALQKSDSDYKIIGFDNLAVGLKQNCRCDLVVGDLRNKEDVEKVFENYSIDMVMHFAALTSVPDSMKLELKDKYFEVNVDGTENLLNVMLKHNCKKLIFSSTASLYAQSNTPVKETDSMQPLNNYALTKQYAEQLIKRHQDIDHIIFRYFNVIGYADWYDKTSETNKTNIVPKLQQIVSSNGIFKVFGNCFNNGRNDKDDKTCVRDYIDVRDIASAHVLAAKKLFNNTNYKQLFNLGNTKAQAINKETKVICTLSDGAEFGYNAVETKVIEVLDEPKVSYGTTVFELLHAFEKANNIKVNYIVDQPRSGDPVSIVADNRKARELLQWSPKYSLEESLKVF